MHLDCAARWRVSGRLHPRRGAIFAVDNVWRHLGKLPTGGDAKRWCADARPVYGRSLRRTARHHAAVDRNDKQREPLACADDFQRNICHMSSRSSSGRRPMRSSHRTGRTSTARSSPIWRHGTLLVVSDRIVFHHRALAGHVICRQFQSGLRCLWRWRRQPSAVRRRSDWQSRPYARRSTVLGTRFAFLWKWWQTARTEQDVLRSNDRKIDLGNEGRWLRLCVCVEMSMMTMSNGVLNDVNSVLFY